MTIGVYAGSFDPITYGHLSVIYQATLAFDEVIVAVGKNSSKTGTFSIEERKELISECIYTNYDNHNIKVLTFDGLLAKYCENLAGFSTKVSIVRGLRAVSDFESEMSIAYANKAIAHNVPTVFFPTSAEHAFVSSSSARELAKHGATGALRQYVPENVQKALIMELSPTGVAAEHNNPCPDCGTQLIGGYNMSGVRCPKKKCGYWFCH